MGLSKRLAEISSLLFFAWISLMIGFYVVVNLIINSVAAVADLILRNLPLGSYLPILIGSSARVLVGVGFVIMWLYVWKRLSEWYFWSRLERGRLTQAV
jgi:hypothetical protein